jgi:hypothetical protein
MDVLTAHPDKNVDFYYGPECGRDSKTGLSHTGMKQEPGRERAARFHRLVNPWQERDERDS